MLLDLTPNGLLATTSSVRKRLDVARPVEREVLEECLRLAQQPRPEAPCSHREPASGCVTPADPTRQSS